MSRNPAAHRLVTKKRRQEQSWRRAMYRMPMRYVTGIDSASEEEWAEAMANAPLMVLPEPSFSMGRQIPAEYRRHVERAMAPRRVGGVPRPGEIDRSITGARLHPGEFVLDRRTTKNENEGD